MPTITLDDIDTLAQQTRDDLLVAEDRALDEMLLAVRPGQSSTEEDDDKVGAIILFGLYSAIVNFRAFSRSRAVDRMAAEMNFLGIQSLRLNPGAFAEHDARLAARAARGYERDWKKAVAKDRRDGSRNTRDARRQATRKMRHRVIMTSATESSEAYNHQRKETLDTAAERYGNDFARDFVRVWDATLDRRTCDICRGAHGTWVEMNGYFFQGVPGSVHPLCRCVEQIVPRHLVV